MKNILYGIVISLLISNVCINTTLVQATVGFFGDVTGYKHKNEVRDNMTNNVIRTFNSESIVVTGAYTDIVNENDVVKTYYNSTKVIKNG